MANGVIELVRRFEPILHFHKDERFFPSDAKRYIEHCALWKAERPFDQKESWGGKGKFFPRRPLIAGTKIAPSDAPGEVRDGDTYLGAKVGTDFPFLVDNNLERRFLELGGWAYMGEGAVVANNEGGVTAGSKNVYSDRNMVRFLYMNTTELRDSQFWYHAELFDTNRLRGLLNRERSPSSPDLWTLFTMLEPRNPALLCYYFFFPGHDE